tara:strand:- start:147 stop:632 length:486 start_codon:yes stop_codon:yes gene_type:complete
MVRLPNPLTKIGSLIRTLSTIFYSNYKKLPDKSKSEFREIANDPKSWGLAIEKAWDSSKIEAENFSSTSIILANILMGRKISKTEKQEARQNLAKLSILIPPLRVFMIPGSQVLLGITARVTPWKLIPDEWIPINALKTVREEPTKSLDKEASLLRRLLKK